MIVWESFEEVVSEEEPNLELAENEEQVAYPDEGELLIIRHNLPIQENRKEEQ